MTNALIADLKVLLSFWHIGNTVAHPPAQQEAVVHLKSKVNEQEMLRELGEH